MRRSLFVMVATCLGVGVWWAGSHFSAVAQTAPSSEPTITSAEKQVYMGIIADDQNDRGRGVRILDVTADGPGAKAGLRTQDLIVSLSGMRVRQLSEMSDILDLYKPGDKVIVEVIRDGNTQRVELILAARVGTVPSTTAPQTPSSPQPSPSGPAIALTPPAPTTEAPKPSLGTEGRIASLELRVSQLEQRAEALEQTIKELLKK